MPQSIKEYINSLKSEKFRAFIIHSKNEIKNSDFIRSAAIKLDGKYLDLLELFENDFKLSNSLDYFNPTKLVELLKNESNNQNLLFVDNMSFLWDTWSPRDKNNFLLMIAKQWNCFYSKMKATLVFSLPTDYPITNTNIVDTKGESRIKEMNEFSAII